jgi:hypothetical protein
MDFKDIKTWGVLLSIILAIGGGFSKFGEISTRLAQIEKQKAPNIKPLEQEISVLKAKISVLEARQEEIRLKSSNPLQSN